jgi:ADP-ribose pyrophosphatase
MWKVQSTTRKYTNEYIEVNEDLVTQPDGTPGTYATVLMKPGVAVLAFDSSGKVYLTEQYRYVYGRRSIEVVCGGIDGDEPPLEAARRELREETGAVAEQWANLDILQIDTSIVRCPMHLFIARGLRFEEKAQDSTEDVKTLCVPFEEALRMVLQGKIVHAPSVALILKVRLAGSSWQ